MTVARVSAGLMDALVAQARRAGRRAYLEMRAASECQRIRRIRGNCSARDLFAGVHARHRGAMFAFTGSRRHRRARSRFRALFAAAENGTWWHPLKHADNWELA